MWESGSIHGSHEALLLQASGRSVAHGGDHGLLSWLGPAAAPPPYMMPHATSPVPVPFGAAEVPEAGGSFTVGGYYEGGRPLGHQYGLFGLDPSLQHATTAGDGAGPSSSLQMGQHGSRMVSGLLGSLQAELGRMTAKEIMDAKVLAASRSHSEAERRRRQRINSHLARLRSLLPNTTKTDKASLLAEVIEHVKELKRQTSAMMAAGEAAASVQQLLPTEADELAVDAAADKNGRFVVRASLCCEDRPDLIPDISRALAALRMRVRRAEIATLGGRVRNVLLITEMEGEDNEGGDDGRGGDDNDRGDCFASHRGHELVASIQEALRGVMDQKAASSDTSSSGGGGRSIKRQRMNGAQEQDSF